VFGCVLVSGVDFVDFVVVVVVVVLMKNTF
jgi:hypothetical protein